MVISTLTLAVALLAAPAAEPGTLLVYNGTMTPVKDDGNPQVKEFTLRLVALAAAEEGTDFAWTLDEAGRGGWLWLDHFGRWTVAADKRDDGALGPALLYEREEGKSIVPLPQLALTAGKIEAGAAWEEGRLEYKVTGEQQRGGRSCWTIDVRSPYGHKRTLWLDKGSPLIVAVRETVFIGQGEEHKLLLELAETKALAAGDVAQVASALDGWLKLRDELGWQLRGQKTELSSEQIAALKAALPSLADASAGTPLDAIALAADRDAKGQKNRAGAVAAIRDGALGQPLGKLKLDELGGKAVSEADLAGQVVVLHFWEYRDAPLEEPYGQTGYLDFLSRKHGGKGVLIYGVHVDPRLGDDETRRASIAAARRLKSFMNLSFPILLDDGALLKRIGDPRTGGGKLPLFLVIGKDGKIAEYRAGLYDVQANTGLAELDAVIGGLK
jgi:hypothetical protein